MENKGIKMNITDLLEDIEMIKLAIKLEEDCYTRKKLQDELKEAMENLDSI